jgi:hypothetical protein
MTEQHVLITRVRSAINRGHFTSLEKGSRCNFFAAATLMPVSGPSYHAFDNVATTEVFTVIRKSNGQTNSKRIFPGSVKNGF